MSSCKRRWFISLLEIISGNAFYRRTKRKHYDSSCKHTTLEGENKTISLYYQGKYVILNLTPSIHPRTFHRLNEFSFAKQGYKAFVPSLKTIALRGGQALLHLKSMPCRPLITDMAAQKFQGVSCDKTL
jgi:hypothetical protein